MALHVIVISATGADRPVEIADGGSLELDSQARVRVQTSDDSGVLSPALALADLDLSIQGQDVHVVAPDGQRLVLTGYAETLAETALGAPLPRAPEQDGPSEALVQSILGNAFTIDYVAGGDEGIAHNQVTLYFEGGSLASGAPLELHQVLEILQVELGLAEPARSGLPHLAGLTVVEQPLQLSEALERAYGPPAELLDNVVVGRFDGMPNLELSSFLSAEEEPAAVNDNAMLINA